MTKVPDGGDRPQVVPRLAADRVHQPRLARPQDLGRAGQAPEGAQGLEGHRPRVRHRRGALLGPLAGRPRGARLHDRAVRRRDDRGDARHRASSCRARSPARARTTSRPTGKEIAFASDVDRSGVDSNFDVFVVPAAGGVAKNLTTDNPAADGGPVVQPRRALPRLFAPAGQGLLRGHPAASRCTTARPAPTGWSRPSGTARSAPSRGRRTAGASTRRSTTRAPRASTRSTPRAGSVRP